MTDDLDGPRLGSIWFSAHDAAHVEPTVPVHRHGLHREQIVHAAVELLDADGLAALSMRKLARVLNVAPMSLYWHVPTKDALLEFVLDTVFGHVELPPTDGEWSVRVRALCMSIRGQIRAHPWVASLIGTYLNTGPNVLRILDVMFEALECSPIPDSEIASAASLINNFVLGFANNEARWDAQLAQGEIDREEYNAQLMPQFAERFGDQFPRVTRHFQHARSKQTLEQFEYGLDLVLYGLSAEKP